MSTRAYDANAMAEPAIKAVLFVKLQLNLNNYCEHNIKTQLYIYNFNMHYGQWQIQEFWKGISTGSRSQARSLGVQPPTAEEVLIFINTQSNEKFNIFPIRR